MIEGEDGRIPKGICNVISASANSSCSNAWRGFIWVCCCGFYETLHKFTLCVGVFLFIERFTSSQPVLAYLKFMNEMRSHVKKPPKNTKKQQQKTALGLF